jgi:hypothetical protein
MQSGLSEFGRTPRTPTRGRPRVCSDAIKRFGPLIAIQVNAAA